MLLETLGIGLVIPALALMSQTELAVKYPVLIPIMDQLGNPSHNSLVIIGMLVIVGVYAFKSVFLVFLSWWQMGFVYDLQANLSQRLFIGYLRQPYTFHLQRNSAQLIRNVIQESSILANSGMLSGLMFLTEVFVLFGILVLLVVVEPLGALVVISTVGLTGWCFHFMTSGYILRWGNARLYHDGLRLQYLQEGLGGVKDVKLLGRENDFLAQYQLHNISSNKVGRRKATMQVIPRLWLELLAVTGLAVLVLVMIKQGKPLEALLPVIGLFAAAAFRLMPSVNRILGALQNIRYSLPVIDILYDELIKVNLEKVEEKRQDKIFAFKNKLSIEHVSFCYPESEKMVLKEANISVHRGTSIGFIGGSGAGKSTLVDVILGLLNPTEGVVKVDDIDIQTNMRGWQNQIGYVPQSIFLTDDTLRRNIAFGLQSEKIDDDAVLRAVRAAQLEEFIGQLPEGLDTIAGERGVRISGGQLQRIGIARALYHDPSVLVLDEATSSLDYSTEHSVMEAVRALQGEKTIIIVAHRLSTLEHCDKIYQLDTGMIVEEGVPKTVFPKEKIVQPF